MCTGSSGSTTPGQRYFYFLPGLAVLHSLCGGSSISITAHHGPVHQFSTPQQVKLDLLGSEKPAGVCAGYQSSMVWTTQGNVWAWGDNTCVTRCPEPSSCSYMPVVAKTIRPEARSPSSELRDFSLTVRKLMLCCFHLSVTDSSALETKNLSGPRQRCEALMREKGVFYSTVCLHEQIFND